MRDEQGGVLEGQSCIDQMFIGKKLKRNLKKKGAFTLRL